MYFQTISMMKQILDTKINMKGHTDSDRNNESNLKLSEARAKAFVEAITNGGINASWFNAAGFGEEKPIADNSYAFG